MQRLRSTFQRSRTPTGAEMKTQSSLEVPKQVRSASFDEIQLRVPQASQRSRSIDVSSGSCAGAEEPGNFLEVPPPARRFQRRRSSGGSRSPACVHCACLEEYNRLHPPEEVPPEPPDDDFDIPARLSVSDSSSEYEEDGGGPVAPCGITVTLSPTIPQHSPPPTPAPLLPSPTIEFFPPSAGSDEDPPLTPTQTRRKSIHRQEAFFAEPTGNSLDNISDGPSDADAFSENTSEGARSDGDVAGTTIPGLVVHDIYLQVPDLRRDRAASVDSCFSKVSERKTEELQHSGVSLEVPVGPNVALRSRSVDIVLPTDEQARYKALAMAAPGGSGSYRCVGMVLKNLGPKKRNDL